MPIIQLGPETLLGLLIEGSAKTSIPQYSVLTGLQLGKTAKDGPRWLNIKYRSILNDRRWDLGEEDLLPQLIAPEDNGGSGPIHVPEGSVITAIQLGGVSLTIWYRKIDSPDNYKLGGEEFGATTSEPPDNGGGNFVSKDGYTITGFEWIRDFPDKQLHLTIWHRPLL